MNHIPIVIPAYEPDERLIDLLKDLSSKRMGPVILVDDGSGEQYHELFGRANSLISTDDETCGLLLVHEVNRGKGAALKTAFSYIIENLPEAVGVVTADSDGQHTPACIQRVTQALDEHPDELVLGVRTFDGEDVPWKSRAGNTITAAVFKLCGLAVTDTQTGLRGIPLNLMRKCLDLTGDRFEFETQMLMLTKGRMAIREVPIITVYDSKDNHQTHFNTLHDSIRIYRVLLQPVLFGLSSLISGATDLFFFWVFSTLFAGLSGHVALSVVLARILSGSLNYYLNSRVVFNSQRDDTSAILRYVALAVVIMLLSAGFSTLGVMLLPGLPEVLVKALVDGTLFVLSYFVQKVVVF